MKKRARTFVTYIQSDDGAALLEALRAAAPGEDVGPLLRGKIVRVDGLVIRQSTTAKPLKRRIT